MPVKLTDTAILAAAKRASEAGKRIDLSDATLPGLRLRLTPAGSRSWVLACRDTLGHMRRFPLGEHPALGLSDAREAARSMRAEVRKGADPISDARRKRSIGREARAGIGTLTALLDLYAAKKGAQLKSWLECRRRIDHVFARQLAKPLAMLKASDLQMAADAHPAQQSAAAAVRYIRPALKWASAPGRAYVPEDLTRVVPPATVKRRDRLLKRDELAQLLPVLRASSRPYAAAMLFMLMTLARREEVGAARWGSIDFDARTWTIHDTKNKQPHIVPLSRQAVDLLRGLRPDEPKADVLVFATASGATLGNWDRETKALQEASGTSGWTRHDLRRTGATMLGEMGELPDIIEAALNHTSIRSSLAATYNRSRYRPQVAAALQKLGDALDEILQGAGRVISLGGARAAGDCPT
jgi:integrase